MIKCDEKLKVSSVSVNIPEDAMAHDHRVIHIDSWVKRLSLAQVLSGLHILVLEVIFVSLSSVPLHRGRERGGGYEYVPGWMPYSGFWAGIFVSSVGVVGIWYQRSSVALRRINLNICLLYTSDAADE